MTPCWCSDRLQIILPSWFHCQVLSVSQARFVISWHDVKFFYTPYYITNLVCHVKKKKICVRVKRNSMYSTEVLFTRVPLSEQLSSGEQLLKVSPGDKSVNFNPTYCHVNLALQGTDVEFCRCVARTLCDALQEGGGFVLGSWVLCTKRWVTAIATVGTSNNKKSCSATFSRLKL